MPFRHDPNSIAAPHWLEEGRSGDRGDFVIDVHVGCHNRLLLQCGGHVLGNRS